MVDSRAWKAGSELGKVIIEMIHLMYQKRTALAFIKALSIEINTERNRREEEKQNGKRKRL
jgi:BioD-like phosphotransacetylase family protein